MKATKDHISLETATLLKDCGVESKNVFVEECNEGTITYFIALKGTYINDEGDLGYRRELYPAFTWGEILWEHVEKFFDEPVAPNCICILLRLIHSDYEAADLFFKKNCILIPQSANE